MLPETKMVQNGNINQSILMKLKQYYNKTKNIENKKSMKPYFFTQDFNFLKQNILIK